MTLSIARKQNYCFVILVILTSMGSFFLYRATQTNWVIYREAEIRYGDQDYKAAIDLYNKSLEAGLPISKIALNLANSYVATGNFKKAIVLYEEYLLEHPQDINAHLELARLLSYIGDFQGSEIEYKKTLEYIHEN